MSVASTSLSFLSSYQGASMESKSEKQRTFTVIVNGMHSQMLFGSNRAAWKYSSDRMGVSAMDKLSDKLC